jgi:hypothetical protein
MNGINLKDLLIINKELSNRENEGRGGRGPWDKRGAYRVYDDV